MIRPYYRYGAVGYSNVGMMGWVFSVQSGFELFEGLVVWCVLAEPPWEACFDDFVVRSFRPGGGVGDGLLES